MIYKNREFQDLNEHDLVVRKSAGSYTAMVGYNSTFKVDINPNQEKNRYVGSDTDPMYPDVIVWSPEFPGSSVGKAKVIEEIETETSVTADEAIYQWRKFAETGIDFRLIVPKSKEVETKKLLTQYDIKISQLQSYQITNGQEVQFYSVSLN